MVRRGAASNSTQWQPEARLLAAWVAVTAREARAEASERAVAPPGASHSAALALHRCRALCTLPGV